MSVSSATFFKSCGNAHICARIGRGAAAAWIGGYCTISAESIVMSALGYKCVHPKSDLLELRWIWLPYPYFIAISRNAEECHISDFMMIRWFVLRGALQSFGYKFTEEMRYYSWSRALDDRDRYSKLLPVDLPSS